MVGLAQRADLQEAGDAAAAGDVGLQHVDGVGLQHAPRVVGRIDVFAGGDIHAVRRAFAHEPQARQVVRGHRLLEPADIGIGAGVKEHQAPA